MIEKLSTNKDKGFTLIELLVVIAIVVITYGIVFIDFDVVEYQRQARDSKRINELLNIQSSLSIAMINREILIIYTLGCTDCTSDKGTQSSDGSGWVRVAPIGPGGLNRYLTTLPIDPVNNTEFHYSYYSDDFDYELNTKLESKKYSDYMKKDGGNDDNLYERGTKLNIK